MHDGAGGFLPVRVGGERIGRHHAGQHFVAAHRVRHGGHGHGLDQRVLHQHAFDFHGRDVLAAAADHVLLAVDEAQRAVGLAAHDVAGVEPAAFPGLVRRRGVLQVAGEETVARIVAGVAHQQLAGFARGGLDARVGDDAYLHVVFLGAEAAAADVARLLAGDDDGARAGLGHGPGFQQREAEARLEGRVQLAVHARAEAEADARLRVLGEGSAFIRMAGITPR